MMPNLAIVIRTRNEERWIGHCLRMVFRQSHKDHEVVIVDNGSTDHTLSLARQFPVRIEAIDEFRPGRALNQGIRVTSGRFIVCLSAHCVPKDTDWLANLVRNLQDPTIAGVYGRQIPVAFSTDADKRDLLMTFGLDHRIQRKDALFHNANSLVRRSVWEEIPFDEDVTNIEDRVWAKAVLDAGHYIAYEPEAEVYHHHGIHQDRNIDRCRSVVKVLQGIESQQILNGIPEVYDPETLSVAALLPVRGQPEILGDTDLLAKCIESVAQTKYVRRTVPILEDPDLVDALASDSVTPILRPPELSTPEKTMMDVLRFGLEELESRGFIPDVVLYANYLYPFRPEGLLRTLVTQLLQTGLDTAVAATTENSGSLWVKTDGEFAQIGGGFDHEAEPLFRAVAGLGCATYPQYVRDGRLIGDRVELVPVTHPLHTLKVRDDFSRWVAEASLEMEPPGSVGTDLSSSISER